MRRAGLAKPTPSISTATLATKPAPYATSFFPHWVPLTDAHPSLAISALAFDPTDATYQTLVAGTGGYSSLRISGPRVGLMRTIDGGATWTDLPALTGFRISGVAPRGSTIVAAADAGIFGCSDAGIYRSINTGANFTRVLNGFAIALASDPTDPNVLYAGMADGGCSAFYGNANGVYKSTDAGLTWTAASSPTIDSYIEGPCNVKRSGAPATSTSAS